MFIILSVKMMETGEIIQIFMQSKPTKALISLSTKFTSERRKLCNFPSTAFCGK